MASLEPHIIVLLLVCGLLAGIVNTLAGSGSLITLPALIFLGIPVQIANGTNRIGILFQTLVGAGTLYKGRYSRVSDDLRYFLPAVLGSVLGALIAVEVAEQVLRLVIGMLMLALLVILLFNFSGLLRGENGETGVKQPWYIYSLLFLAGVYGGFIQVGIGIVLLSVLVLAGRMEFNHANALKNLINFFVTIPAVVVFVVHGHIWWIYGLTIAVSQSLGAWLAASFAMKVQNAAIYIRWLLVMMTLISALELLGVREIFLDQFINRFPGH